MQQEGIFVSVLILYHEGIISFLLDRYCNLVLFDGVIFQLFRNLGHLNAIHSH